MQEYVSRQLGAMSVRIAEDRAAAEKLANETAAMTAETSDLQTKVGILLSCFFVDYDELPAWRLAG